MRNFLLLFLCVTFGVLHPMNNVQKSTGDNAQEKAALKELDQETLALQMELGVKMIGSVRLKNAVLDSDLSQAEQEKLLQQLRTNERLHKQAMTRIFAVTQTVRPNDDPQKTEKIRVLLAQAREKNEQGDGPFEQLQTQVDALPPRAKL